MIEVSQLTKRFGAKYVARDVTFSLESGRILTILGPSGCGKTTLLKMIAGITAPDAGSVRIDGTPVRQLPPAKRAISFVFQDQSLFEHMTLRANIAFPLEIRGLPRSEVNLQVERIASRFSLERAVLNQLPREASGGEQKRAALAQAVAANPRFYFLDEPLTGVDEHLKEALRKELVRLAVEDGAALLHVTHDRETALAVSDEIAVFDKGVLLQRGAPDELYCRPRSSRVAQYFGNVNVLSAELRATEGAAGRPRLYIKELGIELEVPVGYVWPAGQGEMISIGIRPEAVHIGVGHSGVHRLAGVRRSRRTGPLTAFELDVDGTAVLAARPSSDAADVVVGNDITINIDINDVIPFYSSAPSVS